MNENLLKHINTLGRTAAGPVLFDYVNWVLREAQKEKISCLYFLARDGYVLYQIAQKICLQNNLPIQCYYLYCSRLAFRLPSYHLIGDEAYDILSLGGYYVTPKTLLERACLSREEALKILKQIEYPVSKYEQALTKLDLISFTGRLRKNIDYCNSVQEKSKLAYPGAISYLKQAGLFSQSKVAIVDSGWTGSMQRSLRQLMQSKGYTGSFIGFYFGMYAIPRDATDGIYKTWYFNAESNKNDKILFCNNLFECMLAAPHGMTTGYRLVAEHAEPVILSGPSSDQLQLISEHQKGILDYVDQKLLDGETTFLTFDTKAALSRTRRLMRRYMAHPTKHDAYTYGALHFCDDVTEGYHCPLASAEQVKLLGEYSIIPRIYRKLFRQNQSFSVPELFWPYGTLAFAPFWKYTWYFCNLYIWEWLRYTFGKI